MTSRLSPLDSQHRALGAKLVDFGGWEMPLAYPTGTIKEHEACRSDAVAFDVSHLGTVRVNGAEAFGKLQQAFTNDLHRIAPGRAQYTHLLSDDGSVVDDIIVWWVQDDWFDVMPNAANTDPVTSVIGGVDVTGERAVIAVQGPNARDRLAKISDEAARVERFHVQPIEWQGTDVMVAGTGYTGEDGVELAIPVSSAGAFWSELMNAGVLPAGLGARDTLRLEAGLPLHGHELGPGISPLQAGLGWVVAWDKGDFLGRDALAAERAAGVRRRLRGLKTAGRQPLRHGNTVMVDGVAVGEVTSGNYSPMLNCGIALAFLPPDVKVGASVQIDVRGRTTVAEVVRPPFYKHE